MGSAAAAARRRQEPTVGRRYSLDLGACAQGLQLIIDYHETKGTAAESRPEDAIERSTYDRAWLQSTRERAF
jgi:hypothetical protein